MEAENGSGESEVEFETALEFEINLSNDHWSKLLDDEDFVIDDASAVAADNKEVFHGLQERWPGGFFQVLGEEWEVGEKFAEAGQAEIFEAERTLPDGTREKWVLKTFGWGIRLQDLIKPFPKGMLTNRGSNGHYSNDHCCSIYGFMMLQDERFAFLKKRYWGDLQKLIDLRMSVNNHQDFPFPDLSVVVQIMLDIALGMQALHEDGIVHRDLRAANVLIQSLGGDYDPVHGGKFTCHVADFENSVGVLGTSFWRAPEILSRIESRCITPDLFTEKSDVYSFAMTCYEILTGCKPFEGLWEYTRAARYNIVHNHMLPNLPESIDLWIKELLDICWHQDPLQRPSFQNIVNILQTRSGEGREPDILAPRSSTWEELNDPRVRRDRDQSMEIPEKIPILIEMLASALQCCEEEVEKMRKCEDQVGMFKVQCAHLVTSLSSDADKMFSRFQQVQQSLKQLVITNAHMQRFKLNYWFTCIAFGIHSLVDLTRNFQMVVEILLECGAKDWWEAALRYSTTPPYPQIPRWSVFDLTLQQCQWKMDIVHLAIKEISELANGLGDWMFNDPGFQWCEEQKRAVLQKTKELSGSLGVAATLEAQDRDELLKKLESFLYKSLQRKSHKNEFRIEIFFEDKAIWANS